MGRLAPEGEKNPYRVIHKGAPTDPTNEAEKPMKKAPERGLRGFKHDAGPRGNGPAPVWPVQGGKQARLLQPVYSDRQTGKLFQKIFELGEFSPRPASCAAPGSGR
jgi:hypothetical protein